ncbi:MAG: response regulator [Lentimicrobiaceae bacterium]|jgi:CheY-like chemotaxis protein/methyl-accepting chemotaxis protein|nr:response regulator [Lentimicrobiaceae bacterium]
MEEYFNYNKASSWEKFKNSIRSWSYIGVGKLLLMWFLAISIIPLAAVSYINYLNAYSSLTIVAEKSLITTSQLRIEHIKSFFKEVTDFLNVNAKQKSDINFIETLSNEWKKSGKSFNEFRKTDTWDKITRPHYDEYIGTLQNKGFYDVIFIDKDGTILYTLKQGKDLGTNIFSGPYQTSKFAHAVLKSTETLNPQFSDLEPYNAILTILSGHFVQPMLDENNTIIGYVALQITMDRINQIIQQNSDYGETGQAYIIGNDQLLRSSTRFGTDDDILKKRINNTKVNEWFRYLEYRDNQALLDKHKLAPDKVSNYDANEEGKYVLGIFRNLDFLEEYGVSWVLFEEIEHSEAFAYARRLSDVVKLTFLITILSVFFISILVTRWFVSPIKQLSAWAKEVAEGTLGFHTIKAPSNEIGEMVTTFNQLVTTMQSYANIAKMMAKGDYSEKAEIRSNKDVLGKSMNKMIESFRDVVDQANNIAKGDYSITVVPRSNKDTLNVALFEMTKTLQRNAIDTKNNDWLKTGINKLDLNISGKPDIEGLVQAIITFLSRYLNAQLGLFYVLNDNDSTFQLKGSFADTDSEKKLRKQFDLGEGLLGQVAKDQQILIINKKENLKETIELGNEKIAPSQYVICPLVYENTTYGIIQYATIEPFDELKLQFIDTTSINIAIALKTIKASEKVNLLLQQTQEQAQELAIQQEELRQANEELQEQTNALRISEENLQTQQEELKVTNEELEERTRALEIQRDAITWQNERLEAAQKEIEQKAKDLEIASQYKSEFMANMSHELRTPLNSILVLSQLLSENKRGNLKEKELEYANTINSSGKDLLDLINDILDLSKVEAGKIELYLENLFFNDLVNFIKMSFGPIAKTKGLELSFKIDTPIDHIFTDIQRVHQVIKNLYSNALKFTSKGKVELRIYQPKPSELLSETFSKENIVAIAVKDSGIGIATDKLQLIFDAFSQADGTTSRKYGGTGLGLSISKSFVELLGGKIQVESTEGKGSTFTIYLPVTYEKKESNQHSNAIQEVEPVATISEHENLESEKKQENTQTDPQDDIITDDRQSLTENDLVVLVIDDDKMFTDILSDLAHKHGFKCLATYDGSSGLYLADYYLPDAIILDIGLPGMDGYEVMRRLKQNKRTRHIPVYYISASDKNKQTARYPALGYLKKPVNKAELEAVFEQFNNTIHAPIKQVLVVEDNETMQKSIANLFENDKNKIVGVNSEKEALKKLDTEQYDCLILDLGLKTINGFELLENIKKNTKLKDLPIIIYTDRELTEEEEFTLKKHTNSIFLKGVHLFERLLSETTLSLHKIGEKVTKDEDIFTGKTVLIIDDDMRNVFSLTSILESYDVNTIFAKNGRDGIDKLKANNNVDLVLMDIMMPEMDGYEAIREIRKNLKYKNLPIIALTAKAMKDDRAKCIAAGANEYLSKPVEIAKLISILRVWLYN